MTLLLATLLLSACGGDAPAPVAPPGPPAPIGAFEPAPTGARVFFVQPAEGAQVTSPVTLVFGAEGVTIQAAGDVVKGSGHHHILVDGAPIPEGQAVPRDDRNIHYGLGQTEATLPLVPGPHTLTLQLADGAHRSYGTALSATVNITVIDGPAPAAP